MLFGRKRNLERSKKVMEIFHWYEGVYSKVGTHIIEYNDDVIGSTIFEDFYSGIVSWFHENTLDYLLEENLITQEKYDLSKKLRAIIMPIIDTKYWTIKSVREDDVWKDILSLCDKLREMR